MGRGRRAGEEGGEKGPGVEQETTRIINGKIRALSGPAFGARHVSRWREGARDRWLSARGPTRRGGQPPASRPSPRCRWGEWVAVPLKPTFKTQPQIKNKDVI
jgi:hypothetical protein